VRNGGLDGHVVLDGRPDEAQFFNRLTQSWRNGAEDILNSIKMKSNVHGKSNEIEFTEL